MKTKIVSVQIGNRVEQFANAADAKNWAAKWGGEILAANDSAVEKLGTQTARPTRSPGLLTLLGLPANASDGEFSTAWTANKNRATPLDAPAVWEALVRLKMRESKGTLNRTAAESICHARYSKLSQAALRGISGVR